MYSGKYDSLSLFSADGGFPRSSFYLSYYSEAGLIKDVLVPSSVKMPLDLIIFQRELPMRLHVVKIHQLDLIVTQLYKVIRIINPRRQDVEPVQVFSRLVNEITPGLHQLGLSYEVVSWVEIGNFIAATFSSMS
jgi:hypothetical protein